MKCVVNWIPLRIRVRSRNTQPHLKLGLRKYRKKERKNIRGCIDAQCENRLVALTLWISCRFAWGAVAPKCSRIVTFLVVRETWRCTHTHLWVVSTVTVTPSDSDYVNRSSSLQPFWKIHTMQSRQSLRFFAFIRFFAFVPRGACEPGSRRMKSLQTVATMAVTGIRHWIILFCERYWLAEKTAWKRRKIRTSLVDVIFLLFEGSVGQRAYLVQSS